MTGHALFDEFFRVCKYIQSRPGLFAERTPYQMFSMLCAIECVEAKRTWPVVCTTDHLEFARLPDSIRDFVFHNSSFSDAETKAAMNQVIHAIRRIRAGIAAKLCSWGHLDQYLETAIDSIIEKPPLALYPCEFEFVLLEFVRFQFAISRPKSVTIIDSIYNSVVDDIIQEIHGSKRDVLRIADLSEHMRWTRKASLERSRIIGAWIDDYIPRILDAGHQLLRRIHAGL